MRSPNVVAKFTPYQKFVVAVLAFLQFTIILDFMILSPLGAILMPALRMSSSQFGLVVSAYAFAAGASGLLAAGFADRFDRKKLLLFFYAGFIVGTLLCGLAPNYVALLAARAFTGVFAGVIGSIVFAITTDLFPFEMRGRVMGVLQTAFAASQILGLPLGLWLSNRWGWHAPFFMIVVVAIAVGAGILAYLKPINGHLGVAPDRSPFHHIWDTVRRPSYLQAFVTTALLSTGGFMLMPFGSAFSVHNLGISLALLPMVYMVSGLFNIVLGPLAGRMSDAYGKMRVFGAATALGIVSVIYYTHLGLTPIAGVIAINVIIFATVTARMISSSALISAVPDPRHRGSFMSISASLQQISGGLAAALAGLIVVQPDEGPLQHFDTLGYVVSAAMLITWASMSFLARRIGRHRDAGEALRTLSH